jgi:predicted small integral membrane protein
MLALHARFDVRSDPAVSPRITLLRLSTSHGLTLHAADLCTADHLGMAMHI